MVLLRAMQERRLIETERGRIAVGWLIVEDIAMVLTWCCCRRSPASSKARAEPTASRSACRLLLTLGKLIAFVAIMMMVGRRAIPWLLHYVAHTGSRELFRLAVLSIALGVAYGAAMLFDVSFALGAFFAGMILSESELSQRAANETLAAARRLRGAVLRLGRHAVRSGHRGEATGSRCWRPCSPSSSFGKSAAAYAIVRGFRPVRMRPR